MSQKKRNFSGHWPKTPGRLAGLTMIILYQKILSPFIGNSCCYLPTCSEYSYEAIARYGLLKGALLTLMRLIKCGPWACPGFDPVPIFSSKKDFWLYFWRSSNYNKKNDRGRE